jgi:hypothetical protein
MGIEVYFILLFIGVITYFFWRWALTKAIKNPRRRKITIWTTTIVGTPIIYVLIVFITFAAMNYYPEYDFDSVKWKNDKENRYELTKDLIDSRLLIGKSKNEVEQVLGKADSSDDNILVYDVGFVPTFANIDPDIIIITIKNNKVVSVIQRNT